MFNDKYCENRIDEKTELYNDFLQKLFKNKFYFHLILEINTERKSYNFEFRIIS